MQVILDKDKVLGIVDYVGLANTIRDVLIRLHRGWGHNPPRYGVNLGGGWWGMMIGYVRDVGVVVKVVNLYPQNASRGLNTINGLVVLFDDDTGLPLAILDGESLTGIRTATASALSAMAVGADASVLGFIGSGAQARYHALAFTRLFSVREAYVYSRSREHALGLAKMLEGLRVRAHVANGADEVVESSRTTIVATTSERPLVNVRPREGSHIISVGAPRPVVEVSRHVLEGASCILVDTREGVVNEAGEDLRGLRLIELAEVLAGEAECRAGGGYTVYKSVGFAALDLAAAYYVWRLIRGGGQAA